MSRQVALLSQIRSNPTGSAAPAAVFGHAVALCRMCMPNRPLPTLTPPRVRFTGIVGVEVAARTVESWAGAAAGVATSGAAMLSVAADTAGRTVAASDRRNLLKDSPRSCTGILTAGSGLCRGIRYRQPRGVA